MVEQFLKKIKVELNELTLIINSNYHDNFLVKEGDYKKGFEYESIIIFVKDNKELLNQFNSVVDKKMLKLNGRLFFIYPKQNNKLYETYIGRDDLHKLLNMDSERYANGTDIKFNQLLSLDSNFSVMSLKRVDKAKTKKIDKSGQVDTYIDFVPKLIKKLEDHQKAHDFFTSLTPGYQKSWARYIYSAKQEVTQDKRFKEVIGLLEQGIKTKS